MVEKFNNRLIIRYGKSKFTNIYKRVVYKIDDDRYEVETYYRNGEKVKYYKSNSIFNSEQIEELISTFLNEFEFECKRSVIYL